MHLALCYGNRIPKGVGGGGWGVGDELFSVLKNSWVFKQYIGRKDIEKILYLVHFKNHLRSYFKSYELFIVQKAFLFM